MKEVNTIDLFCGAGGATTGLELALHRLGMTHHGLAINHWEVAVETMRKNHPLIETKQMSIEEAVPADLVPSGFVDLLWASPSCTHHSRAKGGKPRSNQLRAQPELVLTWLDQLMVRRVIVENVPEFVDWGPLNAKGEPIKSMRGKCFEAWVSAIRARNYLVEWRVVNCADYGDATTRQRFFLKAVRRGCGKIVWTEPTHAKNPTQDLFGTKKKWRGIRECLDFTDTGKSIFNRKKPLAANTIRRIEAGLRKFCGMEFQMDMLGSNGPDGCRLRSVDEPMATQHTNNRTALVRPFIVKLRNHETVESVEEPISTVTCSGAHHALCTPLVLGQQGGAECRPVSEPCPTIATSGAIRVITPVIVDHFRNGEAHGADEPIGAQTTHDRYSMVTPFVMDMSHPASEDGRRVTSAEDPVKTVTTRNNQALVTPFVFTEQTNNAPRSIDEPARTLTTVRKDYLCLPQLEDGRLVDIRIRMLKPSELAAAHSFPSDYILTGTRGDQVKQIGNSVPVMTAAAMCQCDLERLRK